MGWPSSIARWLALCEITTTRRNERPIEYSLAYFPVHVFASGWRSVLPVEEQGNSENLSGIVVSPQHPRSIISYLQTTTCFLQRLVQRSSRDQGGTRYIVRHRANLLICPRVQFILLKGAHTVWGKQWKLHLSFQQKLLMIAKLVCLLRWDEIRMERSSTWRIGSGTKYKGGLNISCMQKGRVR